MRRLLYFFVIAIMISCTNQKEIAANKEIYVKEFKLMYFQQCLRHGYDNSIAIKEILNTDKSNYGEPILVGLHPLIDSLARTKREKTILQSNIEEKKGKHYGGTLSEHIIANCLCEYNSKWLDAIVKSEYKKQQKADKAYFGKN